MDAWLELPPGEPVAGVLLAHCLPPDSVGPGGDQPPASPTAAAPCWPSTAASAPPMQMQAGAEQRMNCWRRRALSASAIPARCC
ncbi:MAG: hypothetical protein MZW92_08070 [Comamonadaceae bacterium]|nr:hypothetical protein [Comamonadaceae bacterium]